MVHIKIQNFQSIKEMSFDIDGFTTLTGRNFLGKSAVLRAINAALTNQQGDDFINWDEKFCEVSIETDVIKITWHKEQGNNFYKIFDKKENKENLYKKVGSQEPPAPILNAGFGVTKVADEKINLLYAQQFKALFLVDKKGAKSTDLLISIYGLDKLHKAADLCSKDLRDSKSLLKLRKGDKALAKEDLKRFETFEDIQKEFSRIQKEKKDLENKEKELDHIEDLTEKIINCTIEVKRLRPIKECPADLVPDYTSLEKIHQDIQKLSTAYSRIKSLKEAVINLRKAKGLKVSDSFLNEIKKSYNELEELKVKHNKISGLTKEIQTLKKVSVLKVPEINIDTKEIEKLTSLYSKVSQLRVDIKELKSELKENRESLANIGKKLEEFDVCPVCGVARK